MWILALWQLRMSRVAERDFQIQMEIGFVERAWVVLADVEYMFAMTQFK